MKLPLIAALVLLLAGTALCLAEVDSMEFFFDSDPGAGNGIQIYGRSTVDIDQEINTAALTPGIHRLYVRARNDEGLWGMPQSLVFFVPWDAQPFETTTVAGMEYFFDADPGQGNGIQVYGRNAIDLDEVISTSSLSPGIHRLYVRARNSSGDWGMPQKSTFSVPYSPLPLEPTAITNVEYFIDTDPGPGSGVSLFSRNALDIDATIGTSALEPGIHRLYARARNNENIWSTPQSAVFWKPYPAADPLPDIVRLEFFVDSDPGQGNGTQIAVTPGASVDLSPLLHIGEIAHGNHSLHIRAQNENGTWGFPAFCRFSDGIPAHLAISISEGILTLSWDDLHGIDNYKVYSADLPDSAYAEDTGGTYGESSWTEPVLNRMKLFRVTSIYGD